MASASDTDITIGVLAHRPKPETRSRFQPLVTHLKKSLPDKQFRLEVFSYPELEAALASKRLDFVLTNPGHYIQLRHRNNLSGAMATLIEQENGQAVSFLGGVIFSLNDRPDIADLAQLKGKRIAVVGTGSLGGYQAQALELLHNGIRLPEDAHLIVTGMPHDLAIQAVLDGGADAGMVRTGILEEMIKEGKLDSRRIKILNQKMTPGFPYITSTHLYPQWPFFAMPHVQEDNARRVATALLQMPHIDQANGLKGFTIAADYSHVEKMLGELRLPPFDAPPDFTLKDIWLNYHWHIVLALLASAVILLLGIRLVMANRKLSQSEIRYRTVADFTSDWEYWLAPDSSFLYMSPSCKQVCGYTAEEFCREPELLARIIHPYDLYLYTNHIHQTVEGGHPEPFDFRIITKEGHTRWISHVCRTVCDADGTILGQRASNRDITERKQFENELVESRQLLANIIDFLPDATLVIDNDKRVIAWNRAMEIMTGVGKEEILGQGEYAYTVPFYGERRSQLLDLLDVSDEELEAKYHQVERKGEILYAEVFAPALYGGTGAHLWASGAPLYATDQKRVGAIEVIRDISDRKKIEEELQQAKRTADSANLAKSEFLANMSHEIRTPMNGIIGMAQLLEYTELTHEQQEYVSTLKISCKNLLSLVNDILDLSKIEAGKIRIEMLEFSLRECIKDVVLTQQSVIFKKGLSLDTDVSPDVPSRLIGDQLRVKQILLNVLGNAAKFTASGGITISARVIKHGDRSVLVEIAVQDTGAGISEDALENIFMPFTQEADSTTRVYGGSGLGLTISRSLAECMSGGIRAESVFGTGSTFIVTLPFSVADDYLSIASDTGKDGGIEWDGEPLRILLVEDNQINIAFVAALLRKMGHYFEVVNNGRECLEKLENCKFDLILMDIQMPIMNGDEALREIQRREQVSGRRQPVLALTAFALRGEKERFLADGFDGYLTKPVEVHKLIEEMKRICVEPALGTAL